MTLHVGPRYVVTPDRVEWRVGRRWASRRFDWNWRRHGRIASESFVEAGAGLPDVGGVDSAPALLLAAAAVVALLVVIPLLFFGVELIVFGVLVAGGLTARVASRKPWIVEATSYDSLASDRQLEWRVRGWRRSGELIEQVASDLAAGREPTRRELPE